MLINHNANALVLDESQEKWHVYLQILYFTRCPWEMIVGCNRITVELSQVANLTLRTDNSSAHETEQTIINEKSSWTDEHVNQCICRHLHRQTLYQTCFDL